MRNMVFVGTLCAEAILGVSANADPIVSQQQFRNLIGETCLGTIALRDPVWYRMGGNGKGTEAVCSCAVERSIASGMTSKSVQVPRYSKRPSLTRSVRASVEAATAFCGKRLFNDKGPKIVREKKPVKNW